ncbi:cytochrome c/c1 heme-lyase [Xylariaceae sp. FL1019]|nr:cytochrome c/c1 heme-lyase [Xylariaceae sp. FL1019]
MSSGDPKAEDKCPVDHKSREAWLEKARAAAGSNATATSLPPSHPPIQKTMSADTDVCPVDHGAREVWMQQARAASSQPSTATPTPATQSSTSSWTSYLRLPFSSSPQAAPPPKVGLDTSREISTIPRTATIPSTDPEIKASTYTASHAPANNEQETGADKATGNWIYPSQRMFFDAMKRKGHDPEATDMQTVVPIHNAVNERAWAEIKEWERPWLRGTACDTPRLHSFSGLSSQMSPKARINTMLGYQAPFDRHDWVVDRCGKEIEYVIDFYAGRKGSPDGKLSFYLDVRPKLNSWDGVKMRAAKFVGIEDYL